MTTAPPAPRALAWRPLGAVPPTGLVAARVGLHHAAQVANAAAISLLTPLPDDSHTSFAWDAGLGALVAREVPAPFPFRMALRVADLVLLCLAGDTPVAAHPLDGRAQRDALEWVRAQAIAAGVDGARVSLRRHFAIPGVAPSAERPWRVGDGAALRELAAWYANADALLRSVAAAAPRAGAVTCWPHHFDIATLIEEGRDAHGTRRTVGVGLSPGDEYYAEPYLYVGPYPHPRARPLPALPVGRWHTAGWFGAALPGSEIVAAGDAGAQEHRARGFVDAAVRAARDLLSHDARES